MAPWEGRLRASRHLKPKGEGLHVVQENQGYKASRTDEGDGLQSALNVEGVVLACARDLCQERDADRAAMSMLRSLGEYFEADRASLFDLHEDVISNTHEWCAPGISSELDRLQDMDHEVAVCWLDRFNRGECILIDDVEAVSPEVAAGRGIFEACGILCLAAVPFEQDDRVVGFLVVDNPLVEKIRHAADPLKTLGYFYQTTKQRIADDGKLALLSFRDDLTGLYNRNRYLADVERLEGEARSVGIVFLDVNDLKEMNDRFGHGYGDDTLRECADKMATALPGVGLYRIGGDEFVALAPGVDEADFERMVSRLDQAFDPGSARASRLVSIGSHWSRSSADMSGLLLVADKRMYEKKRLFHLGKAFLGRIPRHHGSLAVVDGGSQRSSSLDQSAFLHDYNLLMSSVEVGVSKHLLDEDLDVVWANGYFYDVTGYVSQGSEKDGGHNVGQPELDGHMGPHEVIARAHREGRSRFRFLLPVSRQGGGRKWVRVSGVFSDEVIDGSPVFYSASVDVDDIVQDEVD